MQAERDFPEPAIPSRRARIWAGDLIREAAGRAVIFDMDGVLADTEKYHLESWRTLMLERFGIEPPLDVIRATFGQSNERILPILLPAGTAFDPAEVPVLSDLKEAAYREAARGRVRPLPGAEGFLRWLHRRGIPAAIGTSGPPENVRFLLTEFGWTRFFRALVDRTQFAASKPAPDCFLRAAALLRVPPERCLVFEDSIHGLAAARRAGAVPVAIATSFPEERLRGLGRWTFRDFTEIAC